MSPQWSALPSGNLIIPESRMPHWERLYHVTSARFCHARNEWDPTAKTKVTEKSITLSGIERRVSASRHLAFHPQKRMFQQLARLLYMSSIWQRPHRTTYVTLSSFNIKPFPAQPWRRNQTSMLAYYFANFYSLFCQNNRMKTSCAFS